MRLAIVAYAAAGLVILLGVDRLWPVWPVHMLAALGGVIVVAIAGLAAVAAGRR